MWTEAHTPALAVLIVDDQAAVREGLARLISSLGPPFGAVHTAANAAEALEVLQRARPQLVVLDVDLAGDDGLALLPQMTADAAVLVLTSHGDDATITCARDGGARAFVHKQRPASDLVDSLRRLAALQLA